MTFSRLSDIAGLITRSFEAAGIRGAPTILSKLSKTRLGDEIATARLPTGESISFPAFDPYWCRHLYAGKPYEPDVERLFRHFGRGRVLVDCGANIGYWSVRARSLGFTRAIAIEANAKLIPILERNCPEVIHAAVYSRSGESLQIADRGAASRALNVGSDMASKVMRLSLLGRSYEGDYEEPTEGIPVQTLALNDLGLAEPCLVKLDVEGCEIPALEGADKLDAVFVCEDFPTRGAEVTKFLLSRGYSVFAAGDEIVPITDADQLRAFQSHEFGPVNLAAVA